MGSLQSPDMLHTVEITDVALLISCFDAYLAGSNTFYEAATYVQNQFELMNDSRFHKKVYTHLTCATDPDHMRYIFDSVMDILYNEQSASYIIRLITSESPSRHQLQAIVLVHSPSPPPYLQTSGVQPS